MYTRLIHLKWSYFVLGWIVNLRKSIKLVSDIWKP